LWEAMALLFPAGKMTNAENSNQTQKAKRTSIIIIIKQRLWILLPRH